MDTDARASQAQAAAGRADRAMGGPDATPARARMLDTLSASLGDATTVQAVGEAIVSSARDGLGAAYTTLMLVDAEGRKVTYLRLQPIPDEAARLIAQVPRRAPSATADALVKRRALFHPSLDLYFADYPHLRPATDALGVRALAHLPLVAAGKVLGVLSLSWHEEQPFCREDQQLLQTMAAICALAIQRAELMETNTEIAAVLQRAILPGHLPRHEGFGLAARYLPAEAGAQVGGDWYDAFDGPDGSLWMSIGDVGGHGIEAAALMAQLRNAIRANAFAGLDPARCLDVADRLLAALNPDEMNAVVATAAVLRIDPRTGTVDWCSAGHLPPVLLRADRTTVLVDERHGALLGIEHSGRLLGSTRLDDGDVLVLYTDGLVENRVEPLDTGLRRLAAALGESGPTGGPDAVADRALATSLAGYERLDDLCILAVQRNARTGPPGPAR